MPEENGELIRAKKDHDDLRGCEMEVRERLNRLNALKAKRAEDKKNRLLKKQSKRKKK